MTSSLTIEWIFMGMLDDFVIRSIVQVASNKQHT